MDWTISSFLAYFISYPYDVGGRCSLNVPRIVSEDPTHNSLNYFGFLLIVLLNERVSSTQWYFSTAITPLFNCSQIFKLLIIDYYLNWSLKTNQLCLKQVTLYITLKFINIIPCVSVRLRDFLLASVLNICACLLR